MSIMVCIHFAAAKITHLSDIRKCFARKMINNRNPPYLVDMEDFFVVFWEKLFLNDLFAINDIDTLGWCL